MQTGTMRVEIHVRASASETAVGGAYGGVLVVRVVESAEAGRATRAALRAVAEAVGVPSRSVSLVRGQRTRRKVIEIEIGSGDTEAVRIALRQLRDPTGD